MKDNHDALRQFGSKIGIATLKLNNDGVCELTVGDGLEIFFEATDRDDALRLNGRVGILHNADSETLRTLLVANYGGQATGKAALSMDPISGEIVLGQRIEVATMDAESFASTVETFLKYLTFWTGHLPTMKGAPAAATAVSAGEEHMIRI